LTVRYGIAPCFLGWIIVAATDRGICAIEFGDDPESLSAQVRERFPKANLVEGGPDFSAVIQRVIAFVGAPEGGIELSLDIQGTAFQERVWNELRQVPPGSTVSYAELAHRIGSPEAARAVARACATNRIAVAVPCHRVVRSDGRLSGYRWGVERKRVLLRRESGTSGVLDGRAGQVGTTPNVCGGRRETPGQRGSTERARRRVDELGSCERFPLTGKT